MKKIINCIECHAKLSVPSSGIGTIKCPHCNTSISIENGKINGKNTWKFGENFLIPVLGIAGLLGVIFIAALGLNAFQKWRESDSPKHTAIVREKPHPTKYDNQPVYHPDNLHVPKDAPRLTEPFSISSTDKSGKTITHTYDSQTGTLYESTVFRNYHGKFTENSDGELYIDNFTLNISKSRIHYTKNGETKYWDVQDMGDVYHTDEGFEFKFRKLYLPTPNTYVYVSYDKMVKYAGVFYYVVIIDGVRQYML